eukprot:TRINITY_DN12697_c0_g2_i1.p3 TRINITY_DN12697_c0_g2~~TRINITY_DN12697_c0_g2_i1.p3  ORF type:complete len:210 (+),score=14.40 TRINITY_DN12697_c0_g2_i1:3-632(+)
MYNYFLILLFCLIWIIFDVKDQQNFKQCTHALVVESSANCCGILFFFLSIGSFFIVLYYIFVLRPEKTLSKISLLGLICCCSKRLFCVWINSYLFVACLVFTIVVGTGLFCVGQIVICLLLVWFVILLQEKIVLDFEIQLFYCCCFVFYIVIRKDFVGLGEILFLQVVCCYWKELCKIKNCFFTLQKKINFGKQGKHFNMQKLSALYQY